MSTFSASSLRKLESIPFTVRVRQKNSGVGIVANGYAGLRSSEPTRFIDHVKTPTSGVAAPADSLEFSSRATETARRLTTGLRLAVKEDLARQSQLSQALGRARRYARARKVEISSTTDHNATPARGYEALERGNDQTAYDMPLNGTLSLSIASSNNMGGFFRASTSFVIQSYTAFNDEPSSTQVDTTV